MAWARTVVCWNPVSEAMVQTCFQTPETKKTQLYYRSDSHRFFWLQTWASGETAGPNAVCVARSKKHFLATLLASCLFRASRASFGLTKKHGDVISTRSGPSTRCGSESGFWPGSHQWRAQNGRTCCRQVALALCWMICSFFLFFFSMLGLTPGS